MKDVGKIGASRGCMPSMKLNMRLGLQMKSRLNKKY
jgi:hypothetical protein